MTPQPMIEDKAVPRPVVDMMPVRGHLPRVPGLTASEARALYLLRLRVSERQLPWWKRQLRHFHDLMHKDPKTGTILPQLADHRLVSGIYYHDSEPEPSSRLLATIASRRPCPGEFKHSPFGCVCSLLGDHDSCSHLTDIVLGYGNIGATFSRDFFSGSPQEHAVLNRHLTEYFQGRSRAQQTTPYNIPASQRHLLQDLGMEQPQPDAPEAPHALHKSIEEGQMRRMRQFLPENEYGLISVKASKVALLPTPGSIQNPAFEAKDISRYPGTAIPHAQFTGYSTFFLHDVSSEVTPHELVHKLDAENPSGHLFVTGMNPSEVLDRAATFEPASHHIDYDVGNFNFIFTGSEGESYFTPISVTTAWLRSSSVRAPSGRVYHVVLLDYKLGHCLWHVFSGSVAEQHTRTFPTGSYVQLPPSITGTLSAEFLPVKVLSGILDFVNRTPDLSSRNLAAKVTQVANGINPRTTARERWIAVHIALQLAPTWSFWWGLKKTFWNTLYLLSFQWQMLKPQPDIYSYVDERKRYRVIHPTPSGGWSPSTKGVSNRAAIPGCPSMLQRFSAFTSSVFVFLIPKLVIGDLAAQVLMHLDLPTLLHKLWCWADLQPLRLIITAAVVLVTAILPGHIVKVFSRLSGHFWRQLWWPGWLSGLFERVVTELCGGPGAQFLSKLPGRGWAYQAYLWTLGLHTILPGLVTNWVIPGMAATGQWHWLALWFLLIAAENAIAYVPTVAFNVSDNYVPLRHHCNLGSWWASFYNSSSGYHPGFALAIKNSLHSAWHLQSYRLKLFVNLVCKVIGRPSGSEPGASINSLSNLSVAAVPTVRRRNVDIPLPSVVLQPSSIPFGQGLIPMAVDPDGMTFLEWRQAVEAAWQASPTTYPPLTPGQSCFWDCVATLGGSAHMWYSWYMAATKSQPDPNNPVVGNVTQSDILLFASASKIGIQLTGLTTVVHAAQGDRPSLTLKVSRSVITGMQHVEVAKPDPVQDGVPALARLLATIRQVSPAWEAEFRRLYNAAPADSCPKPTGSLLAMAGQNPLPNTLDGIADAIVGSYSCSVINPQRPGNFAFNQANVYQAPFDDLYEYLPPASNEPIGVTPPAKLWARFSTMKRGLRLLVPSNYRHPQMVDQKIGATPDQSAYNATRNNVRPTPPLWVGMRDELAKGLLKYKDIALPAVPLTEEIITYVADVHRASRLAADLKAHPSVLESRADRKVIQSLDSIVDTYRQEGRTVSIPIKLYLGVFGCGKTTATSAYLRGLTPSQRSAVRIVSHTESLRAQAKYKLDFPELRGFNFPTLGSILTEPSSGVVIFDDAGKFWGGVLDLVILTNPMVSEIIVNGDPAQGHSKFPVAGTQSEYDLTPMSAIAGQCTKYATISHRAFTLLADTLGVHTTNSCGGHITHTSGPKVGIPVCTASPRYAGVLAGGGRRAYTYESIQGEDFKEDVELDLTGLESAIMDRSAYVALTRSSTGVYIHMEAANPTSLIRTQPSGSDLMNAVVFSMREANSATLPRPSWLIKAAFYRHLAWTMPSLPWFAAIGASLPASVFQSVAAKAETHWAVDHVLRDDDPADLVVGAAPPAETSIRETHMLDKERRELSNRGGQTDQFKEACFVNPHVHKRADTATYFLSVEKRLRHSSAKANLARMMACPRKDLCDKYDELVPNPPKWTVEKFEAYADRAIDEYCSGRSAEAVLDKLKSHDPDRSGSDIKITLKNQVIKKDEKRHKVEAIPGQLIHEYDVSQTFRDAPFALFLEDEVISAFPPNFLFYRRMNPVQFIKAYQSRWRVNNGVHTSDVTMWDVGCDAGVLNFDVHVMRRSGFPEEYIVEYITRRLNSRSQHGPMATMQNSGDRYTWSINSLRRAVVAAYVCQTTEHDTIAINGDDEAIDRVCDAIPFDDSPWVFKDLNGYRGDFSGFELGGPVPEYSAEGILYRTMILESRDPTAQDKWTNYLGLLAHANLDTSEAFEVARSARTHMQPALFREFLPAPLRNMFPDVFSE